MIHFLNKIQGRFNRASQSYDRVATIQKQSAEFLVHKLLEIQQIQHFDPQTILDVGTGTGYIPAFLLPIYPHSTYTLNDISQKMLEMCKIKFAHHSNIAYLNSDMAILSADNFDLVISNLALQWVDNIWAVLEFLYSKSSQVFAFSTLLDGTFREWERLLNKHQAIKLHNYPQAAALIDFCSNLNGSHTFHCWVMDIPLSFDNPLQFMRYLKELGASASKNSMHFNTVKALIQEPGGALTVSYKIFFGIFKKAGL